MGALWTPQAVAQRRRLTPKAEAYVLADGRKLLWTDPFSIESGGGVALGQCYRCDDGLRCIATIDPGPHGDLLHVSISYRDHLPDWDTVRLVKDAFFGDDIDAMMVLPRKEDYVNAMPYCFHINQMPVVWGIG